MGAASSASISLLPRACDVAESRTGPFLLSQRILDGHTGALQGIRVYPEIAIKNMNRTNVWTFHDQAEARGPLNAWTFRRMEGKAKLGISLRLPEGAAEGLIPPPPPPLVQATVNDQKLTEPTPRVAWTRVLLTCHNLHDTGVDHPQGV